MPDPALQREFWAALNTADSARIRELVGAGADVNVPIGNLGGETPLIRAVTSDNPELVRLLIELGADVNLASQGPRNWTPLMFAHHNPELIRELVSAGADLNARTTAFSIGSPLGGTKVCPGGATALHLAAATGNAESIRVLLQAGAEVEAREEDGLAPLDYALRLGSANAAAEALVEAGARLTAERLELMHAAAHRPDSDLVTFTFPTESESSQSGEGRSGDQAATASLEASYDRKSGPAGTGNAYRCPKCQSLIHSRRAKLCGQCGAILPPEMVLTDQQVEAQVADRKWARDLADQFDTRQPSESRPGSAPARRTVLSNEPGETFSPEELLRGVSCVEEFRRRDRPDFWLSAIGYTFSFLAVIFLFIKLGFPPGALLIVLVLLGLQCLRAWNRASPICPNCKRNIRFCPATYCHICGRALSNGRCDACGVDNSWTSIFLPYANTGNYGWITYCPGCAAQLDSKVPRWRFGRG
jgi:ankyrin repeat protein